MEYPKPMVDLQHPGSLLFAEWKCPRSGGSFISQSEFLCIITDPLIIGRRLLPDRSQALPGWCLAGLHIYPLLDL